MLILAALGITVAIFAGGVLFLVLAKRYPEVALWIMFAMLFLIVFGAVCFLLEEGISW